MYNMIPCVSFSIDYKKIERATSFQYLRELVFEMVGPKTYWHRQSPVKWQDYRNINDDEDGDEDGDDGDDDDLFYNLYLLCRLIFF